MNTQDDAVRLELAVRAFRAVQPSEGEVDAGVRRAMSALTRANLRRRSRLLPAVIVAILALGALAFAKPSGMTTLLSTLLQSPRQAREQRIAPAQPPRIPALEAAPEPEPEALTPDTKPAERGVSEGKSRGSQSKTKLDLDQGSKKAGWAEVKGALDEGDSARALEALNELRRSTDPATRAKADFGVAQLLWARGERAKACSIARSLTGGLDQRTRERAQALLANCPR